VAGVGVDFRDERASLDLFGPFYGNGKKDIQKKSRKKYLIKRKRKGYAALTANTRPIFAHYRR
jgi:hypothetical protein